MMVIGFGWFKKRDKAGPWQGGAGEATDTAAAAAATSLDPSAEASAATDKPTQTTDAAASPQKKKGAFKLAAKTKKFSIIDHGLTVEGTVAGQGQLVVKGTIKGKLEGEEVVVAEEGAVHADTKARLMTIGGRFEGQLEATETLTILRTGSCSGDVTCKELVVEAGGALNARVTQLSKGPSGK
jgi:cytoskeletal protein CcmA (bactofilin family)